jgi:tetratricopeptide (TPR) repeat protein
MNREQRLGPDEWSRLEGYWETVLALPADRRDGYIASLATDPSVQAELRSLLAGTPAAEAFFERLRTSLPDTIHTIEPVDRDGDVPSRSWEPSDALIGKMLNQYRIDAIIGEGGMGTVYRAVDTRLRRTVALKLVRQRPGEDPSNVRLFAEARAAAALDHPNICTVYEVGDSEYGPFIAMAHYAGETLESRLRREVLPIDVAVDYATQIARGLGAAHDRGIIHRDVKPANIIVTAGGVVKLLDFGVAGQADDAVSFGDTTPGTIAYMSPEQLRARPSDHRTDLWSLGVVIFELCTGVRPFRGADVESTVHAIVRDDPVPLASLRPGVPPEVSALVERLLEKDPSRRYQDTAALLNDLNRSFGRATSQPPARRWSRRVVAGVAIASLATGAWMLVARIPPTGSNLVAGSLASERRMAAIDLYRQGHADVLFRTDSGRRIAMDLFARAIAIDSSYAPPHASLGHMFAAGAHGVEGRERLALAERYARNAIRLDSTLAMAHAALGHALMSDYRLVDAEAALLRSVQLVKDSPAQVDRHGLRPEYAGEFLVGLYIFLERPAEALRHAQANLQANPDAPTAIAEVARALLVNNRCDETLQMIQRLASLNPPPARAAAIAAQCYAKRGMWQEAIGGLEQVAGRNPGQPHAWLAFMLAQAGQISKAIEIRDRLLAREPGNRGAYQLATVYAGIGEYDSAFAWLDRSIDDRSLTFSIMEPAFEELRRDARFDRVRTRLGIPKR